MQVSDEGRKIAKKAAPKKEYIVPDYIIAAIKKKQKAFATFENFASSHRKEYAQWIDEAKTEPTKEKKLLKPLNGL